jgi:hypothetical protein
MNELQVAGDITQLFMPLIGVMVTGIIALSIKDYITKIAKGMAFARNRSFNEGDHVILDKEPAIIVKVGVIQTVFGITKPDGNYVWRYVPNERIDSLKLERIIFNNKPDENGNAITENTAKIEANMEKLTKLYGNMPKK